MTRFNGNILDVEKKPFITIGIVLYLGEEYLKPCLTSLCEAANGEVEILLLDQSPGHRATAFINAKLRELSGRYRMLKGRNLGHSGGHNRLLKEAKGRYYICGSYDMFYPSSFFHDLGRALEEDSMDPADSYAPALYRWEDAPAAPPMKVSPEALVDSYGIGMTRGHAFFDIGQGRRRAKAAPDPRLLGPTGALGVYRTEALRGIGGFDESLHYKNDVELAYRMRWAGCTSRYLPHVFAWHDRQLGSSRLGLLNRIFQRNKKERRKREDSFVAHQKILQRHFSKDYSAGTKMATLLRQGMITLYARVFEPYLIKALKRGGNLNGHPGLTQKKGYRKASPKTLEELMI